MKREKIKKLVLSAMFVGAGIVLPLLTSQIKEIGENFVEVFWKNITYQLSVQAIGFVLFFVIIFVNLC